jgi:hypothetical protein
VKDIQDNLESQWDNLIISELLLESTFSEDVLANDNMVHLRFEEIDVDNKIKQEEHAKDLFKLSGLTHSEFRQALSKEPIPIPEDGEDQDLSKFPEWRETYWKLIEEPTNLIRSSFGKPGDPFAPAAASVASTAVTPSMVNQAKQEAKQVEVTKKAQQKPVVKKDSFVSRSYAALKSDVMESLTIDPESSSTHSFVSALVRAWEYSMLDQMIPIINSSFLSGFNIETGNQGHKFLSAVQLGRKVLRERLEKYLRKLTDSLTDKIQLQQNQQSYISTVFDSLEYRLDYILDTESKKANSYGRFLGAQTIAQYKNMDMKVVYSALDTGCPECMAKTNEIAMADGITIEELTPHHPHCQCSFDIVFANREDSSVDDGVKIERCVSEVKSQLASKHPTWSSEKISSSAWAICQSTTKGK